MADLIDGVTVKLAGKDYVIPPLTFKALRKLQPKLAVINSMGSVPTDEQMQAVVDLVHGAMVRNYPEMTANDVEELLDMKNTPTVIQALMGVSGLEKGEAMAGSH